MKKIKTLIALCMAMSPVLCHAEDALQACRQALSASDYAAAAKLGQQAGGFDGAMCAGHARQALGDATGAIAAFAEAEHYTTDPFNQMVAITFLARASQAAGKSDEALGHYERSLKIARQLEQKQAQMINLNESGAILQAKGDLHAALEHYHQAYPLAANDNERSECDQSIAAAYSALGDYDKAIEYQVKSVVLEERSGDFNHELNAKLELAGIATKARDYPRAQKMLDECLNLARTAGSAYWEARAMLYLGRMEKMRGNSTAANAALKSALDLAKKIGAEDLSGVISAEILKQ